MFPAPFFRLSTVALIAVGTCVVTADGFAQLTRTPTDDASRTSRLQPVAPADPAAASLAAVVVGPGGARLTWSAVPGGTRYFVTGPGAGPSGTEVTTNLITLNGVPGGRQEWAVASMPASGPVLSGEKNWPRVAADMPFFSPPHAAVWWDGNPMIDFTFQIVREATNLRLFRTQGTNAPVEVPLPQGSIARTPNGPGDNVRVRIFFPEMQPEVLYNFNFTAVFPTGARTSEYAPAQVPLFVLRTTVPPARDRVIVEWNTFGVAPYTLEKGTMVQQGGTSFLAFTPIRDAAGNPVSFTTVTRYEDLTVQPGATYRYKVCANLPSGRACPVVAVTLP